RPQPVYRWLPRWIGRHWLPGWVINVPFVAMHLACLAVFFTGFHWFDLVLCGFLYFIRMFGITAGYHRYFAHRSYRTSRAFQFAMAWLGCSALHKGPLWWSAHHRDLLRYSDTPDDPHSPHSRSVWWAHVGWLMVSDYDETKTHLVRDWNRYPELRFLNRFHWLPGIALAVLCWLVGGWSALAWGFFVS